MLIEDEELRTLFKAESEEHLLRLDTLARRLEDDASDTAALTDSLRVTHSLKGAARMVGVADVEMLAHHLEDLLSAVRSGTTALTDPVLDEIYAVLDGMSEAVREAVSSTSPSRPATEAAAPRVAQAGADSSPPADEDAFRIETMRVDPVRLDRLMNHAGELDVARTRVWSRLEQLTELVDEAERSGASQSLRTRLTRLREEMEDDVALLDGVTTRLEEGISAIRLVPFAAVFDLFPRMVREIARDSGKEATLDIRGGSVSADKRIVEAMKDPLMHLLRNAIDHGVELPDARAAAGKPETATITVSAEQEGARIVVQVSDDGRGLDAAAIRRTAVARGLVPARNADDMGDTEVRALIFAAGFSTARTVTDISGRGIGLDAVKRAVEKLDGTLSFETFAGEGSTFLITLPVSLAATRVLIVSAAGEQYALPLASIVSAVRVEENEVFTLDRYEAIRHADRPVPLGRLSDVLERPAVGSDTGPRTCVIVTDGSSIAALSVTALIDEQELIVKPHTGLLKRVRNVAGATILPNGVVCPILNVSDLLKSVLQRRGAGPQPASSEPAAATPGARVVLLAEDSITTRTWEKRLLESAGYEVVTAVDGRDALQKFGTRDFDAVVSDIQMPNLDGLELVEAIRRDSRNHQVPIVLVTSLASEEDRRRGLDAGADAYLVKSNVDQTLLVETLKRLIG